MAKNAARIAVRTWLVQHEKTQGWLAAKVGIADGRLSKVLAGVDRPSERVRKEIRRITGVDVLDPEGTRELQEVR